jgi:hypothetical protein
LPSLLTRSPVVGNQIEPQAEGVKQSGRTGLAHTFQVCDFRSYCQPRILNGDHIFATPLFSRTFRVCLCDRNSIAHPLASSLPSRKGVRDWVCFVRFWDALSYFQQLDGFVFTEKVCVGCPNLESRIWVSERWRSSFGLVMAKPLCRFVSTDSAHLTGRKVARECTSLLYSSILTPPSFAQLVLVMARRNKT